ncbi:MAG: AAA family ATPase [Xanthomonadales bacterium]|nr:AAA family ATPase [Xanthomonadales bacterium]
MYLEFYGLREAPFAITPDPRFVFLSDRHRDALAHLVYGIGQGGSGGFVQLTGEVGTGKTTLSRLLLGQLPERTRVALVLNPRQSPVELLESITDELRLDIEGARGSAKALVDRLNHYLLDAYAQGLRVVLIVDEAQQLPVEALEQIRLLTNLETPTQKLLQIILLGQPELRVLLDRTELRQLAQRVTARYHLTPLDEDETEAYLRHRLAVAGATRHPFTRLAMRSLHRRSGGVPRLINVIAERALLAGYVADELQVGERLVEHAADEVLGVAGRRRSRGALLAAALVAVVAAVGWMAWRARAPGPDVAAAAPAATNPTPASSAVPTVPPAPQPAPDPDELARAAAALPAGAELVAWTHLLGLWRADPAQVDVREAARCPASIAPGLSCLRGSGNLAKLRALGRPVLLVLHPGGRRTLALLLALDADGARLDLGTRTITVPYATLDQAWLGQYLVVWREPAFLPETVRRGEAGAAVDWVQAQLARFDTLRPAASGPYLYDETMEARVRQVQAGLGLVPDGIVGPETALALASRDPGGPRLGRQPD